MLVRLLIGLMAGRVCTLGWCAWCHLPSTCPACMCCARVCVPYLRLVRGVTRTLPARVW